MDRVLWSDYIIYEMKIRDVFICIIVLVKRHKEEWQHSQSKYGDFKEQR